jgi:prepilin-type N-terminal cleavage/methylation domain-containing protein
MSDLKIIHSSNKGFSLIETSIVMGLLGLIVLLVMLLSDNLSTQNRKAEVMMSKVKFISELGKYVRSDRGCRELLTMGEFINATPRDIIIRNWRVAGVEGNPMLLIQGNRRFKDFNLLALRAEFRDQSMSEFAIDGVIVRKGFLRIMAQFNDQFSRNIQEHIFNISVNIRANNTLFSCNHDATLGQTCTTMGGTYDAETGSCDAIAGNCFFQGTFSRCNPPQDTCSNVNNPTTNADSCPGGTVQTRIGDGGNRTYFICMTCPPPTTALGVDQNPVPTNVSNND